MDDVVKLLKQILLELQGIKDDLQHIRDEIERKL